MIAAIREVVLGLKATGVATVLVEQRVDAVLQIADRVAFMGHGTVAEVVPGASLRADAPQFAAFVGV
jgi:branched-chain amino acid transport system ATP-binding protein